MPNRFFSDLLPLIDDLAELKVTVFCFWALQQRDSKFRYVRLRDLLDDQALLAGLAPDPTAAEEALSHALDRATERGTLLHVTVPIARGEEDLYFMNTERGRIAIKALERGDWQPGTPDQPVALITERPNIFAIYEQNIGPLTPLLSDILRDAENTYPTPWIDEAMRIAVENNIRNWKYVEAILKRWTTDGKTESKKPKTADSNSNAEQSPYLADEYFQRKTDHE